jgi:hypothetical protein
MKQTRRNWNLQEISAGLFEDLAVYSEPNIVII